MLFVAQILLYFIFFFFCTYVYSSSTWNMRKRTETNEVQSIRETSKINIRAAQPFFIYDGIFLFIFVRSFVSFVEFSFNQNTNQFVPYLTLALLVPLFSYFALPRFPGSNEYDELADMKIFRFKFFMESNGPASSERW